MTRSPQPLLDPTFAAYWRGQPGAGAEFFRDLARADRDAPLDDWDEPLGDEDIPF